MSCCGQQLGYEDYPLPSGWDRHLGAITPDAAAQEVMPQSTVRGQAGFTQAVYDGIKNSAASGHFVGFNPSGCGQPGSSAPATALSLVSSGSQLALQGAVQAGLIAAGPATLGITIAIAGITALFGIILAHHAAAVRREQQVECAAVPAAENYLQIIDQAVYAGHATPAQGIEALQSLLHDFENTVASITQNDASHCNAGCVWTKELEAIVTYKTSEYLDLAAAAPPPRPVGLPISPIGPARPNTVVSPQAGGAGLSPSSYTTFYSSATPATLPASSTSWLPIAAIAIGAFFLLR